MIEIALLGFVMHGQVAKGAEATIESFQLDNKIKVIIAHVADAPQQSTFVLLPLHLGNDGPGRAQWSHLLEHHLIRSTDPEALAVDGMEFNGETTHEALRLDSY